MRKTRLVILPTKCLHQMGFLLLFLSCPVIGDWGRIRPESEDSHNAIQIDRKGTCGLIRDPPGGLLDFLNETGFKQCRLSENSDLNEPTEKPVTEEPPSIQHSRGRRVHIRRNNQRLSEQRMDDERRDAKRQNQRSVFRFVRSRSVESRRFSNRNDLRVRSLSLSRLENERVTRQQRFVRHSTEGNRRRETDRLHMSRQSQRREEQQKRFDRELPNERRENGIAVRTVSERRERETRRLTRSLERERQDSRRDSNRSFQGLSMRRGNDIRTQTQEKIENIRERNERRLSLTRRKYEDANKAEKVGSRRGPNRINLERRLPEFREARSMEFLIREKSMRINRNFDNRRYAENKRSVNLSSKISEKNSEERRNNDPFIERMNNKDRRINAVATRRNPYGSEFKFEKPFEEVSEWMNLKDYQGFHTGDWTTNCVIGAVVYFLTTRQTKTV